jgi:ABC-type glycerol-3-phosphate transport system substrate-binding protein
MDAFSQQGYIPADVDLADSIVYKNPAVAKTMKVAIEAYGEISPMIVTQYKAPNLYSMYQAVQEDLGPYFLGQVGVDEAVTKLEKDIADIMKQ